MPAIEQTRQGGKPAIADPTSRRSLVLLVAILSLALALRLLFMLIVTDSANSEGIYYLRIAENLVAGRGYVGLRENGLQLLYPPLYPGLIAFGTMLVGHAELVARIINVIVGTTLVVPTFLIARLVANDRVALLAALLTAIHPYLIAMSTVILTETLYIVLLLSGIYGVLSSTGPYSLYRVTIAGLCFGLAYLVRPEAMIFAIMGTIALAVIYRHQIQIGLRMAIVFILCTTLLAAPYIAWLSSSSGQLLLESKSADNYANRSLLNANVPAGEIFFGINDDLSPKGSSMISNLEEIREWHVAPLAAVVFALKTARQSLPDTVKRLASSRLLGDPILASFALLGLARGIGRRRSWLSHLALAAICGGTTFALLLIDPRLFRERYLFPFLPPMLIWGADGIEWLSRWVEEGYARVAHPADRWRKVAGEASVGIVLLLLVLLPASALGDVADLRQGWGDNHTLKETGFWLKSHAAKDSPRLMDTTATAAYYAGGVLVPFPYTSSARALAFIERQNIDFLVLSSQAAGTRPYMLEWIEHGIPDPRATIVYRIPDRRGGEVLIYRWTSATP